MKSILCYGDSNTWGQIPTTLKISVRYSREIRWTGVLQSLLGAEFNIVEEGLKGRTVCHEDPYKNGRNGHAVIPMILETHSPIDAVIVMLGTNDLKAIYNVSAYSISEAASRLIELIKKSDPNISKIVLVSPPQIVETDDIEHSMSFEGAIEKSKNLSKYYSYFATKWKCFFLDAGQHAQSSMIDGVHLEESSHQQLGKALANLIKEIFLNPENNKDTI